MMNEKLYIHRESEHNLVAPRIVVPLLIKMLKPRSVLDVGCGIGTWLKAFEESGVTDYLGIDGNYVDTSLLKIQGNRFLNYDLRETFSLNRKFDLVMSLEVAEHLPENSANAFVKSLVTHGDTIVFSAAIPMQGGQNHVNEQPPEYWAEKFKTHGYYFHDVIRPLIWNNDQINWWYRQNVFLVTKQPIEKPQILFMVHPEMFYLNRSYHQKLLQGEFGVQQGFSIFIQALIRKLKKLLRFSES